jgi:hypothetical protein
MHAFLQLHTVYMQMRLTLEIGKRYPWKKGKPISRSEHLGFVWLQQVNLCYMFKERYKRAANRHNAAMKSYGREGREDVAAGLKKIEAALGAFIKSRGQHVHEWDSEHQYLMMFSVAEFLEKHGKPVEGFSAAGQYGIAKIFLTSDIRRNIDFMEGFN